MPGFQFQNISLELILLTSSLLLVISVLSSRISSSFGIPSLLLFLGIGMLAGSEGPGQIDFENYSLAFAVGSICLALIIFDGGMRTLWSNVNPILKLGSSLSFFGTLITGAATGIYAHYMLNLTLIEGLLLGAIVSSTDAAAVFSIMRAKNLTLKGSLEQTLEFEAGSNDPVAIFLTIGVLSYATTKQQSVLDLGTLFLMQTVLGSALGWTGGKVIRWLINHVGIEYEGLYGVLVISLVICLFSVTALLGGSGFLAVYIAGLTLGNSELIHKGSISRFVDGIAWVAQILVFLTLGLLAFPSQLMRVWKEGLILAAFMMFAARPLSVLIATSGSDLLKREKFFISWVGLRGVAPVILATLPMGVGFPHSEYFFNLVFFVVLITVLVQGISIPWVAKLFDVAEPLHEVPPTKLDVGLLPSGFISIEILVKKDSPSENRRVVDLMLPAGVLLTSLERDQRYLIPRGDTLLAPGDKILALARPSNLDILRGLFGDARPLN